jgi:hypothetical protein
MEEPAAPTMTFGSGCFAGVVFVMCTIIAALFSPDEAPDESTAGAIALGILIAIPVAGYVTGIALAVRRSTRRAGFGLLVVLTIGLLIVSAGIVLLFVLTYQGV